jgi:HSP20 family molecular chaperone IbpA
LIIPFISLSDNGSSYVVLVEAPGLSISNIEFQLNGRELVISSGTFAAMIATTGALSLVSIPKHRIRFPGPVADTGPPVAEAVAAGRLRVTLRKAKSEDDSAMAISSL